MTTAVLVTGGAGFIGSHLARGLLDRGYRVRVLDDLSFGTHSWVPAEAEFVLGDITSVEACRSACSGVEGVFHCAAMSRAGPSNDDIHACTQKNIVGTQNVMVASRDAGVRKVVYSGSSTYYGNQPPPQMEDGPPDYLNFYALSKHVGEQYCLMFDRLFDVPAIVLRYFNVYGPRQPRQGPYALVMGIFLDRWRRGLPLEIHGSGEQRRDFIHVRDVVEANVRAYESSVRGEVFNVGTGTNVSVKELADLISPNQIHVPRRPGDAEVTLAAVSRIRERLGWHASVRLEEGLREIMDAAD